MKNFIPVLLVALMLASCSQELTSETKTFTKKSTLPCKGVCPKAIVKVPEYKGGIVADSINKKLFSVMKEIIYFGEEQYDVKNYQSLVNAFMASYEKLQKDEPDEPFGWEADVKGKEVYRSEKLVDIELEHYTFTGGAHGYAGKRSLIFDLETGKHIDNDKLFTNVNAFRTFAEIKFRQKFKLPASGPINSGGLMFEDEKFNLPQTIFFTDNGLLLYYNTYEIASYAEGPQELLIPYPDANKYLAVR